MSETFQAEWFTIPEFARTAPKCMYHKENEDGGSDGCTVGGKADDRGNLHVLARARLLWGDSGEIPAEFTGRVILRITADDYYKLYVNGRYAGQGPAPAYPEHYYYNELDITPCLHKGKNILAVHLYYQGLVNRVWNSGDGRFGIACEILGTEKEQENKYRIIPRWRYHISHAYSGEVTGYDTQFLEDFDSRRWDENWREESFDDHLWSPMVKAGWADYRCSFQPVRMVSVYRRKPKELRKTPEGWFVDMGEEIAGALTVWARSEKDGGRIVIRCGEELEETGGEESEAASGKEAAETCLENAKEEAAEVPHRSSQVRYQMRCNCRYEETWTLKRGNCRLEPYDYKGFRYASLQCDPGVTVIRVEAEVRHYPMDDSLCRLSSGSPVLDGIFNICKNGVKYGTQEGYLDCPTREKGQYLGDAVIASHAHVWLTGDVRMLRKCIDQFAASEGICPGLMAVVPGSYMQEVADFSLLWSQLLMLDYQFTGDRDFLRKYYPTAAGIIEHFRQYERADGLLEQAADKWNLVDWPENLRDGYDFRLSRPVVAPGCHNVLNALYLGAVKTLERMGEILGDSQRERRFEMLKDAFVNAFFDSGAGLFRDSTVSAHSALHSNIYTLYLGLCPAGREGRIADFLVEKGLCCGVMTGYFYLKALAAAGRHEEMYQMLVNETEHGWANMLREGATSCWEAWGKDQKWNTSLCHPWAAGPIPVIIEDVAGFVPDPQEEEGFRFEPHIPKEAGTLCLQFPFRGKQYQIQREQGACHAELSAGSLQQEEAGASGNTNLS